MPTKTTPKVTARKITDYQPDPANPNAHTERGARILEDSLATVGLGRSIVVDKNGIVLAGNSTQERAVDQGFEDAIEIESDGTQLIVVKRNDLDLLNDTDHRARELTFFDNRSAEAGIRWDVEQLQANLDDGIDLSRLWSESEMQDLINRYDHDPVIVEDTKDNATNETVPDCRIELTCSKADFALFQPILESWAQRPGVVLTITA